ncbi:MAG: anaerobic ribonucleoside-triphosphate reductase activating protein [Clostridiales bacterium GWF2_38_85]|nr:MAG: anaerobic ribonucleoside-triphosphate reductase activating protein [Clostridiales bacterium GWF2_38_85]HBL85118.1 anaerobic ribonucleoside-triphosphate reductase activating protein [Clostridiales bacterium]
MTVVGLVKNSFVDYPETIACVIFLPYCNYNCYYCHNRSLIDGMDDMIDEEELDKFLEKRRGDIEGVVITGGEPTLQPDLIEFIEYIRSFGYKVKLDTNGSNPDVIEQLLKLKLCDFYAVDYKAPKAQYSEICGDGATADDVIETIWLLINSGVEFEVRTTVAPELDESDLITMSKELPVVPRYSLNKYRKPEYYLDEDEDRVNKTPYTQLQMKAFAEKMKLCQPNIKFE